MAGFAHHFLDRYVGHRNGAQQVLSGRDLLRIIMLGTFRKAQKVVRLLPVRFGLQVFIAVRANSGNDPNAVITSPNEVYPTAGINLLNRFLLRFFPTRVVGINSPNVSDPFIRIFPVIFIDAPNRLCFCQLTFSCVLPNEGCCQEPFDQLKNQDTKRGVNPQSRNGSNWGGAAKVGVAAPAFAMANP